MLKPSAIASVLFLSCLTAQALEPSWNVRNAAEKLLDKYALRLPADDWFLQRKDGVVLQYFKPTICFSGGGTDWSAQVYTAKWRIRENGVWSKWNVASGRPGLFRAGLIQVTTPPTGGASARFTADGAWFEPFKPASHSWVTHIR